MTCFLTYSVNGVRIAGDISIQSEFIPLVNVYFLFSMVFTLVSMVWYVVSNSFATKRNMPKPLIRFVQLLEPLFCVKKNNLRSKQLKTTGLVLQKINQLNESLKDPTEETKHAENEHSIVFNALDSDKLNSFEEQLEDNPKMYEMYVERFNYFMLSIAFLIMAAAQALIWIAIVS